MQLPNVTGVGVGEKGGKKVIKVFVTRKVPNTELQPGQIVPRTLVTGTRMSENEASPMRPFGLPTIFAGNGGELWRIDYVETNPVTDAAAGISFRFDEVFKCITDSGPFFCPGTPGSASLRGDAIPEPSTSLFGLGLAGLAAWRLKFSSWSWSWRALRATTGGFETSHRLEEGVIPGVDRKEITRIAGPALD